MINPSSALEFELQSTNDTHNDETLNNAKINTTAINGLRGFLAIYIVVFHSLVFSKVEVNILGSTVMTFFFLISGFVLGMNDGKRQYAPTKCCSELCISPQDEAHFNAKHFWRRRIARTLPLFYLTSIMCIPLVYAGRISAYFWGVPAMYVMNLFVVHTWFGFPAFLNGPAWFVSTMWFFYWIFPSLLPKLQRRSILKKQKWITWLSWIQFIGGGMWMSIFFASPWQWAAFWIATGWPPSRLPVFIMGVFAGLLRNEGHPILAKQETWTLQNWRKCSDRLALLFLISFLIIGVVENLEATEDIFFLEIPIFRTSSVWMQNGIAWFALLFIVSLTFDEGTSRISKMLTSKVALECGRISYAVYLVHEPLRKYLCWTIYGAITRPACDWETAMETGDEECKDEWGEWWNLRLIPMWCVPVVWIVSIAVAVALNRLVEEPMRKWLRPSKKKPTDGHNVALAETQGYN